LIRLSNGKENKVEQYGLLEKRRKTGEGKEEQESERTHKCRKKRSRGAKKKKDQSRWQKRIALHDQPMSQVLGFLSGYGILFGTYP
jgi:hypothetical protein